MKFVLLTLDALLLLQLALLLPVVDSYSKSDEGTIRERYLKQAFDQILDLFSKDLKDISEVFQNVVDKASHVEIQSDALKKHLANFTEFISNVKDITETENENENRVGRWLVGLMKQTTELTDAYENACHGDPEAFPEKLSLDQNGLIEFRKKSADNFVEFETKFREPLDAYLADLTPQAAKQGNAVIDWYNEYKNADGFGRKFELLITFLYD